MGSLGDNGKSRRKTLKTYSHLLAGKSKPDDYDISSSGLLYHKNLNFEVKTKLAEWHIQHHADRELICTHWDDFSDPARLTYFSYTAMQKDREIHVRELFQAIEDSRDSWDEAWLFRLAPFLSASRYLFHCLQMASAQLAKLAPSGKLVNCSLFQAANEIRRTQHFAYYLGLLRKHVGMNRFLDASVWESDPAWQGIRQQCERILIGRSWAELFVRLNLQLKPLIDEVIINRGRSWIARNGDGLFAEILRSLQKDCEWQLAWSEGLVNYLLESDPRNGAVLRTLLQQDDEIRSAVCGLLDIMGEPITHLDHVIRRREALIP